MKEKYFIHKGIKYQSGVIIKIKPTTGRANPCPKVFEEATFMYYDTDLAKYFIKVGGTIHVLNKTKFIDILIAPTNKINKKEVNKHTYNLYLEIMYNEKDLEILSKTKDDMQAINDDLNLFLDKVETMINMLKDNSKNWYVKDNQLYFKKDNLVKEYNSLYEDLNKYVKEKFTSEENTSSLKQTSV